MGESQQCSGSAGLQPEGDVRAVPLVAGLAHPIRIDRRPIHFEPEPVDGGTVEEAQFNGSLRLRYVRCPPLAESLGGGDQRVDGFRCPFDLDCVLNVWQRKSPPNNTTRYIVMDRTDAQDPSIGRQRPGCPASPSVVRAWSRDAVCIRQNKFLHSFTRIYLSGVNVAP